MTDAYSLKNIQIFYFDIVIGFSVNVKHMQITQQNWSLIQASGNQQIKNLWYALQRYFQIVM